MPCLACIVMTIYWHGKAWLSLLILFAYFFLFAFFFRFLSKDGAKVRLFAQRVVVVFTTFNIDLQLSAGFAQKRGKNGSRRLRKRP